MSTPRRTPLGSTPLVVAGFMLLAGGAAWGADPTPALQDHDHGLSVAQAAEPAAPKTGRSPGRKDAQLYIGWPNDGDVVATHFKVWFGLRNFGVAPAGVDRDGTGHHHLLIDAALDNPAEPIPNDKQHLHFGAGQTETYLDLALGRHTLQLVLADANHVPHDPPIVSKKISITVVQSRRPPQVSER